KPAWAKWRAREGEDSASSHPSGERPAPPRARRRQRVHGGRSLTSVRVGAAAAGAGPVVLGEVDDLGTGVAEEAGLGTVGDAAGLHVHAPDLGALGAAAARRAGLADAPAVLRTVGESVPRAKARPTCRLTRPADANGSAVVLGDATTGVTAAP